MLRFASSLQLDNIPVVNLSAAVSRTFGGTAADLRKRQITGRLVTLSRAAR
jgi:hypothetical protein